MFIHYYLAVVLFMVNDFIILKLVAVIDWSWILVFSPLWISFFLWIVLFVISMLRAIEIEERKRNQ